MNEDIEKCGWYDVMDCHNPAGKCIVYLWYMVLIECFRPFICMSHESYYIMVGTRLRFVDELKRYVKVMLRIETRLESAPILHA